MKIDLIQSIKVPIDLVENNTGQIPGVNSNPREMTVNEFNKLKKSLKRDANMTAIQELKLFPFNGKWVAIGGNMRLHAMRELGWKEVIAKPIPADTDAETLNRYILLDNANFGKWDFDKLANEWDMSLLDDCAINIPGLGELAEEPIPTDLDAEEDDFDETKDAVETKVRFGDIWQLGEHRLMCGNSTDGGCVSKLMNAQKADMVFKDPPYNVAIGSKNKALNDNMLNRGLKWCNRIEKDIAGDKGMTDEEIGESLWLPAFANLYENAKDDCAIYVTMPQGGTHMMMMMMMHNAKWKVKHELIWVKNSPTFSMGRLNYDYQHEPILYGWKKTHNWYGEGKFNKSIWEIDKPKKCDLHPTMKPIALVENAILNSSRRADVIVDLFGGSGSTLIACEQLKRKCFMMEYDEHYCDVIVARWEKLTGEKAVKIQ